MHSYLNHPPAMFGQAFLVSPIFLLSLSFIASTWATPQPNWTQVEMDLHPPHEDILAVLKTDERLLVSGGPGDPYPEVKLAFQLPQLGIFEAPTFQMMDDVKHGLQYVFQTKNSHTLAVPGTGSMGMQTVLDNMVEPGDIVLIPVSGMWTQRASSIVSRLGGVPIQMDKPFGVSYTLSEIEAAIIANKPRVVFMVSGETTTGVFQSVQGIGELCHTHDCFTIVDIAHVVGIQPFFMDKWKIDMVYSNVQKGIGAPPGLAPVSFSDRAVAKILLRKKPPMSYVYDVKFWQEQNYFRVMGPEKAISFVHSPPILLLYTLREAISHISREGLLASWKKHSEIHKYFEDKLMAEFPQLEYQVVNPQDRLTGALFVRLPSNLLPTEVKQYVLDNHKVDISCGLGPTTGKVLRFALLGVNANKVTADRLLEAMRETFKHFNLIRKSD